ncbi:MAG: glycosyltransferase family 4 protein [Deltaproteobacteria bacterium]|nr:glycosyltransferase family 4 protein [Deltaproteobacteria bacterium]
MRAQPKESSKEELSPPKLVIFDTHPIQYRSPVFAALNRLAPATQVYFFSDTFREFDKSPRDSFNIPLKKGFTNKTLRYSNPFVFWIAVRKILCPGRKQDRPTAALIYGYYLWEHWLIWLQCKLSGTPILFVGETFSLQGDRWRGAIKRFILPILFRTFSQIITIGKKNRRHYESLGVSKKRLTEAHYCVDGAFFELETAVAERARHQMRERYQIPCDAFVMLFVGRLFDRKRPEDALEIHRLLCSSHPSLHTLIVGAGELESHLREAASHTPRLTLTGFLDQRTIRDLYCAADCLIVPSQFETWGLVVNEAMHAGIVPVVTDTCGVAGDLVVAGETGVIFKLGEPESAARQIAGLIDNPRLLRSMANAGKKLVNQEFSVDQFAEAILGALQRTSR